MIRKLLGIDTLENKFDILNRKDDLHWDAIKKMESFGNSLLDSGKELEKEFKLIREGQQKLAMQVASIRELTKNYKADIGMVAKLHSLLDNFKANTAENFNKADEALTREMHDIAKWAANVDLFIEEQIGKEKKPSAAAKAKKVAKKAVKKGVK